MTSRMSIGVDAGSQELQLLDSTRLVGFSPQDCIP